MPNISPWPLRLVFLSLLLPLVSSFCVLSADDDLLSNSPAATDRWSYVDDQGVLRWRDDESEVTLFGVNYYTPFTVDYEGIAKLKLDHRSVIDTDVSHFVRLNLDVIRLHVFDRQISDAQGNLIANQHLDLFDYLVAVCKKRGIHTVLTPIAWWHYHFKDAGFSSLYTKPQMVLDPKARKAQANYLKQFLEHVNPYTGLAYKSEPAIVAIELINEPEYDSTTTDTQVTEYIECLAEAVRSTGATQPIFYNGWAGREAAVGKSSIEGCTFGWYPTGLVSGHSLPGNYLPLVDDFPRMRLPELSVKAKIVYEFDAADVPGRVMYPAMARAFRSGGAQIATQFQYDPAPLAALNYGWHTHYLNLVHAPGKTISFAIAAEAFRQTPRLASFEGYPKNTSFGAFRVDYAHNLSEMVTETRYMHANTTGTPPPNLEKISQITGCGRSPLVKYDGTGAYFLDRIQPGVWRLELFPDAVWVRDPFSHDLMQQETSRLIWTNRPISVRLPDLGSDFSIQRIQPDQVAVGKANNAQFDVSPGAYVLIRNGVEASTTVDSDFNLSRPVEKPPVVWWQGPTQWRNNHDLVVKATVAGANVRAVTLYVDNLPTVPMKRIAPYTYSASIPAAQLQVSQLTMCMEVDTGRRLLWFPQRSQPHNDPLARPPRWTVKIQNPDAPFELFVGGQQRARVSGHRTGTRQSIGRGSQPDTKALRVEVDRFDPAPDSIAVRNSVPTETKLWRDELKACNAVAIRARATVEATDRVEFVLIEEDSSPWGTITELTTEWQDIVIPLGQLRFFHHWSHPADRGQDNDQFHPENVAAVNFCFGSWLFGDQAEQPHGIEIERVEFRCIQ